MNPTPAPQFDLKLLVFIQRHGGRVGVRQLTRSLASCRPAAVAQARLDALVRAGMGVWTHSRSSARGGRPSRAFTLTLPAEAIQCLMELTRGVWRMRGRAGHRQIMREVMAFLNRYRATPCAQLAVAVSEVAKHLVGLGENEPPVPMCRREMSLDARGRVTACWEYRSNVR